MVIYPAVFTTELLGALIAGRIPDTELDKLPLIEEYRLSRSLGHGAMGCVYLAQDTLLDRPVALKFLLSLQKDRAARQRFLIEARAIARLSHGNVVGIYRIGELLGQPFLVSEFVRGTSLDRLPRPLPSPKVRELGLGLARGLSAAHQRGVLHRDVKPHNAIVTDDGTVKVLDFGLAKLTDRRPTGTASESPSLPPPPRLAQTAPAEDAVSEAHEAEMGDEALVGGDDVSTAQLALQQTQHSDERSPQPQPLQRKDLTQDGAVLGTPLYMAPEIWQGQAASPRSDLYSLGAVLFELATGQPPYLADNLLALELKVMSEPPPKVHVLAPDLDVRLGEIIDRCLVRSPAARFASVDELCHALDRLGGTPKVRRSGNPFLGLRPFDISDSGVFFGRGSEVTELLTRLRSQPLLLLAGDSGVGKSSLCRAGVAAAVLAGALGDQREYQLVEVLPGHTPGRALCDALAPVMGSPATELYSLLRTDPQELARLLQRHPRDTGGLLLLFDQLEELITQSEPFEAELLSEWLGLLTVRAPGLRVLLSARGDFLTRLSALPGLGREFSSRLYIVRPLSSDGLRQAIIEPAAQLGVHFESTQLVDELLRSTLHTDGGLPLLQFALAELWEARDTSSGVITESALTTIGGVFGALARHADQVYRAMLPTERVAAKRLLLRLLTAEGLRATRLLSDLRTTDPAEPVALEALVRGRLLLAREVGGETAYELAHEALVKAWDELRRWIDSEGERRVVIERLAQAAAEWERLGQSPDLLWNERRLLEVELLSIEPQLLTERSQHFLTLSQRQSRSRQRTQRGVVVGLLLLPLLALLLTWQYQTAAEQKRLRETAEQSELGMRAINLAQLPGSELLALKTALRATLPMSAEATVPISQAQEGLFVALRAIRRSLPLFGPAAHTVALSPTGQWQAVAAEEGPVRIYHQGQRVPLHTLSATSKATHLVWKDQSTLVVGYLDGSVRLFAIPEGRLLVTLAAHRDRISELMVVDDGKLMLSASLDGSAALWELPSGQLRRRFDGGGQRVSSARVGAGRVFLASASGSVEVLRITDGSVEKTLTCSDDSKRGDGGQLSLTTTGSGSDGQLLVVAGGQAKVCVFSLPDLSLRGSLDLGGQRLLLARHVSPTVVLLLGRDGLLRTFDASSQRSIFEYRTPTAPRVAALSPHGERLLIGGSDGSIWSLQPATGKLLASLEGHSDPVLALAASDELALSSSSDGSVRLWQPQADAASLSLRGFADSVEKVLPLPDGKSFLAVTSAGAIWNSDDPPRLLWQASPAVEVALANDGAQLVIGNSDGTIEIRSLESGKSLRKWPAHRGPVTQIGFSSDGSIVHSSSRDHTAALWRASDGQLIERLVDPNYPVTSVELSSDGKLIATASSRGRVTLWERPTNVPILLRGLLDSEPVPSRLSRSPLTAQLLIVGQHTAVGSFVLGGGVTRSLWGHLGPTLQGAFAPNGQSVVTLGKDRTVRVFDAQLGTQLLVLRPEDPRAVTFSSDGTLVLVAGGRDRSVKGYPSSLMALRRQACELLGDAASDPAAAALCQ
ncbi:MAG: protein kinase [Myxococcales bacterium]|nr:protein kinase [Myxococcales bacterium]